jgi:hypothetical protein
MGLMNLFEQGEAIKAYGVAHIIKSIPYVNELAVRWGSGNMTPQEGKAVTMSLMGRRARQHELFIDIREDSLERQAARFKGRSALSSVVGWSEQLASASPLTRFLRSTEDNIVLAAQDSFLGEVVNYTFTRNTGRNGKQYNKGFFDRETMARNNVSEADMNELMSAIKENVTWNDKDKTWTMSTEQADNFKKNLGALTTLRRFGDHVAQEVIQKNNLSDTNLWAGSASNPMMNLIMQFKTFAMRSYDKRISKSMNRAAEGDTFGQGMTVMIGSALGTMSFLGQTGLQTLGMTEEQREKYLTRVFGSTDWKNDSDLIIAQSALSGAMRSSIFASLGLVPFFNPQIKSTTTAQYSGDVWDQLKSYIPSLNTIDVLYKGGQAAHGAFTEEDEEKRDRQIRRFWKATGQFTNVPVLSKVLYNLGED